MNVEKNYKNQCVPFFTWICKENWGKDTGKHHYEIRQLVWPTAYHIINCQKVKIRGVFLQPNKL